MTMLDLRCEFCKKETTFNENVNNEGLCDECFKDTVESGVDKTKTKILRGCSNYLECKNEANIYLGMGDICDKCRGDKKRNTKLVDKKVYDVKGMLEGSGLPRFISGLKKALSVEKTT